MTDRVNTTSCTEGEAALPPLRMLLVDDDQINRKILFTLLTGMGCSCTIAGNGQEAVETFKKDAFDAIMMDCAMPIMDGYTATREVRKIEADRGTHTWIVALTANAMPHDREKCLVAGMDDFITKPVQSRQLKQLLEKIRDNVCPSQ